MFTNGGLTFQPNIKWNPYKRPLGRANWAGRAYALGYIAVGDAIVTSSAQKPFTSMADIAAAGMLPIYPGRGYLWAISAGIPAGWSLPPSQSPYWAASMLDQSKYPNSQWLLPVPPAATSPTTPSAPSTSSGGSGGVAVLLALVAAAMFL